RADYGGFGRRSHVGRGNRPMQNEPACLLTAVDASVIIDTIARMRRGRGVAPARRRFLPAPTHHPVPSPARTPTRTVVLTCPRVRIDDTGAASRRFDFGRVMD